MTVTFRDAILSGATAGRRYRLRLPREAMRGASGSRLGSQPGSSLDFHDYREYMPGDDLRRLDWSVYARSDREVVKLYREEIQPHLDILVDATRSMSFPDPAKASAALALAAALAAAAGASSCQVSAWAHGSACAPLSPRGGPGASDPLSWDPPQFADTPPEGACVPLPHLAASGIRVFVGDLLSDVAPEAFLRPFAHGAAAVYIVQVLSAGEEDPGPLRGATRLADAESGEEREVFVDESAIASYLSALAAMREEWSRACRSVGAQFIHSTAEDIISACASGARLEALERHGLLEGA